MTYRLQDTCLTATFAVAEEAEDNANKHRKEVNGYVRRAETLMNGKAYTHALRDLYTDLLDIQSRVANAAADAEYECDRAKKALRRYNFIPAEATKRSNLTIAAAATASALASEASYILERIEDTISEQAAA